MSYKCNKCNWETVLRSTPLKIPNSDSANDASNGAHVNMSRGIGCLGAHRLLALHAAILIWSI